MAYTTINKSTAHFNTKLYTGNGGTQSITGVGFKPDFTWFKNRSETFDHAFYDIVRGAYWTIQSNTTSAQTANDGLTAWTSDGFNIGNVNNTNKNGNNICSWNWLAGGSQGSSNTDGTINTTYTSANTTAGFSISKYTGTGSTATVGHGLGAVPKMMIIKATSDTTDWQVYHNATTANNKLILNSTAAAADTNNFGDTTPTSSVFTVNPGGGQTNDSGETYIAYCFAEKTGYSKFGSYIGNGSSDGVFVYTGFRPAFLIVKRTDSAAGWSMVDSKRDTYNSAIKRLLPAGTNAENTSLDPFVDLLSNGFNLQAGSTAFNGSGGNYIYMAIAEAPLVGSNNVPCTAR